MTTSQLIDTIKKWTTKNPHGPTFADLHSVFGGDADTLEEELDKAR